jgi:hypothetical protein
MFLSDLDQMCQGYFGDIDNCADADPTIVLGILLLKTLHNVQTILGL